MPEEIQPHPRLGVNLRRAIELCGICGAEYGTGVIPMGMQNYKYVCPECSLVHYGEPPLNPESNMMECPRCKGRSRAWKMIELKPGEPVKTGIGCCTDCRKRLGKDRIAFIEIKDGTQGERTGNVYFAKPAGELARHVKESGSRAVYAEQTMVEKLGLNKRG